MYSPSDRRSQRSPSGRDEPRNLITDDMPGPTGPKVTQVSYLQCPALHCEAPPVSNMLSFSTAGERASVNQLVQTEPLVSSPPFRLRVGLPYWQMAVLAGISLWLY